MTVRLPLHKRIKEDVSKERIVHIPTTPSASANWTMIKERAKAAAKQQGLLHRRGTGSAMHGEKESARKGVNANTSTLNQQTPKHPLLRLTPNNRPRHKPSAKQRVRKVHIAMPAREPRLRKPKRATRTLRRVKPRSRPCITIVMPMSESSRWSGETEIPEKYVWFREILENDVSEEVECLKNEDEQWRNNSMWYKGFYEDMS